MYKVTKIFMVLFVAVASFVVVPKTQADLSTACTLSDAQMVTTLALQPDESYYSSFLAEAIAKNN